jgi:predicted CopG family antitoxin
MTVRTVTVTDEAYQRLRAHKGSAESFSELIIRLTGRAPLSSFAGTLAGQPAKRLRRAIAADRRARKKLDLGHIR